MANAATYQCPNCNGVLAFDASTGRLTCSFCGGSFDQGEVERAIPVGESVEVAETEHVKTVDEFLEHAPWEAAGANAANAKSYGCPSCGAEVVADQSAVTTSCPYCGNNMVVSGIASAENIPQYVLPFGITKDEAEARMRAHFEHKWYLSRKFDASLEHMQGVYVPYHLYDMHVSGWANYIGYDEETDDDGHSSKTYNAIKRAGYADFERIPVDGSSKMPDGHMDAISPFNFDKLRPFSASYVAGYLAEVADENADACLPRADARARRSFEDSLESDARDTRFTDGIEETVASETNVQVKGVESCVLPVWLMHCTWDGNQMLFAVNGETGKCVGDLPIDGKRRALTIIGVLLLALLLSVVLGMFVLDDAESKTGFVVGAAVLTILAPIVVDAILRGQMHTAVEATNASGSFTEAGLVVTDRWDSGKFYMRKSKARSLLE